MRRRTRRRDGAELENQQRLPAERGRHGDGSGTPTGAVESLHRTAGNQAVLKLDGGGAVEDLAGSRTESCRAGSDLSADSSGGSDTSTIGMVGSAEPASLVKDANQASRDVQGLSPRTVHRRAERDGKVQVVDVRSPAQFRDEHVPGARNVPLSILPERVPALGGTDETVLCCRSGRRSKEVARLLASDDTAQDTRFVNMTGGIQRWQREVDSPTAGEATDKTAGDPTVYRSTAAGMYTAQPTHGEGSRPRLPVSSPGDRLEVEAERVAERVMRTSRPTDAGQLGPTGAPNDQLLSTADTPTAGGGDAGEPRRAIRTGGHQLPDAERSFFEERFGRDFGDVRVHTGKRADEAARSLDATAFTIGTDIVFRTGAYRPGTPGGRHLLAHELTHVVQQGGNPAAIQRDVTSEYSEIEGALSRNLVAWPGELDWAVTDEDASAVLDILESLSDEDLLSTYYEMIADGFWSRLEANVPDSEEQRFDSLTSRIGSAAASATLDEDAKEVIRTIIAFFFPNREPTCVNEEVAEVAIEMVAEGRDCSNAMDFVPRPPKNPSIGWAVQQVGKPWVRRLKRGGTMYQSCKNVVMARFRSRYETARISCRTR